MLMFGFIGTPEIIPILSISLVLFIVPLLALIDILKNEFEGNGKLMWVLGLLVTWILGAALYYFIGRKQKLVKL